MWKLVVYMTRQFVAALPPFLTSPCPVPRTRFVSSRLVLFCATLSCFVLSLFSCHVASCHHSAAPPVSAAPAAPGSLSEIILKFTTVADGNQASSFAVRREEGATVGRGAGNDISIPNDSCMGESDHASIVWRGGAFHVEDRGHPHGASVRIGTGRGLRDWPLDQGSMFSAGNSVFHTT